MEEAAERIELLREGYMPADPDEKLEPSCQFGVDVLAYATKAILYHQKHGKAHPEYVQQVQGALMITGRKWWDQVFYHPDLPLLIVRQIPQVPLFVALARGIEDVCEERDRVLVALQRQAEPGQQAA